MPTLLSGNNQLAAGKRDVRYRRPARAATHSGQNFPNLARRPGIYTLAFAQRAARAFATAAKANPDIPVVYDHEIRPELYCRPERMRRRLQPGMARRTEPGD